MPIDLRKLIPANPVEARVIRAALSSFLRSGHPIEQQQEICEEFIGMIDAAERANAN